MKMLFAKFSLREAVKLISKYWVVLRLTWEEYFVWRVNFVLWRVRQLLQLITLYFFWSVALSGQQELLGYTQAGILTYILGTQLMRSIVLSSRSIDVAGEIHDAKLTNYLIRPVSYFGFWAARDISDKFLNIAFSLVEVALIIAVFGPPLVFQQDAFFLSLTLLTAVMAIILYFLFSFLLSLTAFWVRDIWAPRFLSFVILEFFAGGFFPVDILPRPLFILVSATPFPYLIYFPIKIYLGQLPPLQILAGLVIMLFWIAVLTGSLNYVWNRGLRVYSAEGR